jgi:quinol monooxygenase YgiN
MPEVNLIVRAVAKVDKTEELRKILLAMVAPTHAEPGEKVYDLYASDTQGRFFFFEVWTSREALGFHAVTPHHNALEKKLPDLLAEPIELNFVTAVK